MVGCCGFASCPGARRYTARGRTARTGGTDGGSQSLHGRYGLAAYPLTKANRTIGSQHPPLVWATPALGSSVRAQERTIQWRSLATERGAGFRRG